MRARIIGSDRVETQITFDSPFGISLGMNLAQKKMCREALVNEVISFRRDCRTSKSIQLCTCWPFAAEKLHIIGSCLLFSVVQILCLRQHVAERSSYMIKKYRFKLFSVQFLLFFPHLQIQLDLLILCTYISDPLIHLILAQSCQSQSQLNVLFVLSNF